MALNITNKTLTYKESPPTKCFHLVYKADTKKIILNKEVSGITRTTDELFCALAKEEVDAEITRLGLIA
jgi:hypothetical protein